MKPTISVPLKKGMAQTGLHAVMLAEKKVSAVIPTVMAAVWSVELSKTLQSALTISRQHQETLRTSFHVDEAEAKASEKAERAIMQMLDSQPKGSARDLSLALLVAKMIREKIRGYEHVLNADQFMKYEERRMLGGALSDDVSTDLFLQELAERFVFLHRAGR